VFRFLPLVILLWGCSNYDGDTAKPVQKQFWQGVFHTDHHEIPFRFYTEGKDLVLLNVEEEISLIETKREADSVSYSFPQYGGVFTVIQSAKSEIAGYWQKEGYKERLPFTATPIESRVLPNDSSITDYYRVAFVKPSLDTVHAIGIFNEDSSVITGTFLTATGDYRSFEGTVHNEEFALSHFDGRYLNYALFRKTSDSSIEGVFQSNNHEPYQWHGGMLDKQPSVSLDGQITAKDAQKPEFTVKSFDGAEKHFSANDFYGQVTVVQVFGSWCPNCHDELIAFRSFNTHFNSDSLVFIPVAFEYDNSLEACKERIDRLFKHLDVPFAAYYGGVAKKSVSAEVFPFLSDITAYPTSVFIDKRGNIRKIQSGFTGPGTGAYYDDYIRETRDFIALLLAE
jgi:thiol-disulfide isomerase/thioredoxin